MKKISTLLFCILFTGTLFAQDVRLNDSVIFINDKPIALYDKELNKSSLRYNMGVYSFTDYVLIKAEVIKFVAPIDILKPFYYYELTFPPTRDTFSIYVEEEAFPLLLAKIIRDYNLISNDQLSTEGVKRLKASYPGGAALVAKIKEIEDYLVETHHINEQVARDRTKPVKINDKVIVQDGVKIGWINTTNTNIQVTNRTLQIQPLESLRDYNLRVACSYLIMYVNDRNISGGGYYPYDITISKGERGYELYQLSKTKKIVPGSIEDLMLIRICGLIGEYYL